jgi:hypothetical protein
MSCGDEVPAGKNCGRLYDSVTAATMSTLATLATVVPTYAATATCRFMGVFEA